MLKGLWFLCKFGWKSEKRYVIYNVLLQFVNSLIPLVAVAMPKYIIDELMGAQRPERIVLYVGILAGYTLAATCAARFLRMQGFTHRLKVEQDFQRFIERKLVNVDFNKLESPAFWETKEKAEKFLYADWHGFSYLLDSALDIIGKTFTLAGVIAIIATLNLYMVALFAALAFACSAVEGWAKKNGMELSMESAKFSRSYMYFSGIFGNFAYGKEIRLYGMGDWLLAQAGAFGRKMVGCYKRRNGFYIKSGAFAALMSFVQQCAAYAYLTANVIGGTMAIGDFTMYVGAVSAFADAMRAVMESFVDVKAYGPYYEAMEEYLNMPETMRQNKGLPVPAGEHAIEFRNVSFRYPGQERDALKNISLTIRPGEKLAVVGENGAGKTTFIKLLMRLYDPDAGEILLDGVDIRDVAYGEYMALFSTVFQDYKLYAFSLKENIAFGKDADDGEIEALLRRVGLGERLDTLPKGVHTAVYKEFDEKGFEPSGGEGQRIALARALFKDAPVVVLDEPTAALDPKAEYEIYCRFDELAAGKTAVYISHRLSSAKFCDRILVFRQGEIVEEGAHDALMASAGIYAELFTMQARYYA